MKIINQCYKLIFQVTFLGWLFKKRKKLSPISGTLRATNTYTVCNTNNWTLRKSIADWYWFLVYGHTMISLIVWHKQICNWTDLMPRPDADPEQLFTSILLSLAPRSFGSRVTQVMNWTDLSMLNSDSNRYF